MIRKGVEVVLQALIDAGGRGDRRQPLPAQPGRTTWRNGARERLLATKAGDGVLRIPKLRRGSFFPSILERRRRKRFIIEPDLPPPAGPRAGVCGPRPWATS